MKPQNDKEFQELDKHKGTENYEVVEIIPKKNEASYFLIDKFNKNVFVNSFFEPLSKEREEIKYNRLLLDIFGSIKSVGTTEYLLKDGTMWDSSYYVNWVINGDTTKHKYIDPSTNKEIEDPYEYDFKINQKDPEKWLEKFKELYTKAQYVYIYISFYYFKIDDIWYLINTDWMGDKVGLNIEKHYPAKEDQDVRMVALKDLSPNYSVPPEERDISLIKEVAYKQTFFEKENWGLIKSNYSAGWWYLEIYMPKGDVIKIKRYASYRRPDIELYKIPKENGGRDDVLFIVQEPNSMHMEQQAGMYVIRPRNYKETPQYKEQQAIEKQKQEKLKAAAARKSLKKRRNFFPEN